MKYIVTIELHAFPRQRTQLKEFPFPTGKVWDKLPFRSVANMALRDAEEYIRSVDPTMGIDPPLPESGLNFSMSSAGKTYFLTYHKED